jgi:hypothetical protein
VSGSENLIGTAIFPPGGEALRRGLGGWGPPSSNTKHPANAGCRAIAAIAPLFGLLLFAAADDVPRLSVDDAAAPIADVEAAPASVRFDFVPIPMARIEAVALRHVAALAYPGVGVGARSNPATDWRDAGVQNQPL